MPPIALDMDGFASFRERTRVDFSDADFFALVGPTGSGKSTIIDAMTFALFGLVSPGPQGHGLPSPGPHHFQGNGQACLRTR